VVIFPASSVASNPDRISENRDFHGRQIVLIVEPISPSRGDFHADFVILIPDTGEPFPEAGGYT
jgi:hypothetical protein